MGSARPLDKAIAIAMRLEEEEMRGKVPSDPAALVRRAAAFWDHTPLSAPTRQALERYARRRAREEEARRRRTAPADAFVREWEARL